MGLPPQAGSAEFDTVRRMTDSGAGEQGLPYQPTADVAATIEWLTSTDFRLVETRGPEGMGSQLLCYEAPSGARVQLVTDRGQWMMSVRPVGWSSCYDFDVLVAAVQGREVWEPWEGPLPVQLPAGVVWREALPEALEWLESSADPKSKLDDLRRRRASGIFPPTKRR